MIAFQIILIFTIGNIIRNLTGSKKLWTSALTSKKAAGVVTVGFVLSSFSAFAQDSGQSPFHLDSGLENLLLSLNGVLLLCILILLGMLRSLIRTLTTAKEGVEAIAEKESAWSKLMQKLTDSVPVEEEEEVMTDHEYDGIVELDNNLPPWWLAGFYITIVAAVVYIGYYHVYLDGNMQEREFKAEMAEAAKQKEAYLASLENQVDESNVTMLEDKSALAEGKSIYDANCVACHGNQGQGGVGPNLTDKYWLHGGSIKDVFKTIKYGVTSKGMIAWEDQLTPPQMQKVASYVKTFVGTNPPNQKEPQGEIWEPEVEDSGSDSETDTETEKGDENTEEESGSDQKDDVAAL
ncbi:c-type cytochrome [Salibacter halophilus]|uniref:C-type cytochrome n=2 Tax=Salibacter halophilus TaxID=1803916 RepID=A0A6N6M8F8_9FLAO|nr:c-type cytochrome [Salibacter halophilus]